MGDNELRFQRIYDEYYDKVNCYLKRMVGDGEAEDLTQEVFIKIGKALETFRGEAQLSTWIYRIATHTALDRFRATHAHESRNFYEDDSASTEEDKNSWTGEREASTEQKVIREEMNECIRGIINTLPEAYRTVIILSELEGLKDGEIAQIMGTSLQATKIRIHRARVKLKDEMTKACVFYRDEQSGFACDRKNR